MTNLTSTEVEDEGTIVLSEVDDDFSSILKQFPSPPGLVDLSLVPATKRYSYEYVAELSGYTVEQIKAAVVFELLVPLCHRSAHPRVSDITNTQAAVSTNSLTFSSDVFNRSPAKFGSTGGFHTTPSLPSFSNVAPHNVPMSPSVNIFPPPSSSVPTHSTPSLAAAMNSYNLARTVTREQVDACRRNFSHNQTISLDHAINDDRGDSETPPMTDAKGEKLNRTFTKGDLILMRNGIMEQTVTKYSTESDDESSNAESLASHGSNVEQSNAVEQQSQQMYQQPQQQMVRPAPAVASGIPAPFTSRLLQPKVYSSNQGSSSSLVGSVTSLASGGSTSNAKTTDSIDTGSSALAPPPALTRAGTFTKDSRAPTVPVQVPPPAQRQQRGSIGVVLPNKMVAPRASALAPVATVGGTNARRTQAPGSFPSSQQGQSMNVHAYRYPSANAASNGAPKSGAAAVRKSSAK